MRAYNKAEQILRNADLLNAIEDKLENYQLALKQELHQILDYWIRHTIDNINGGFVGRIDHENKSYPDAPKGSVLNSRILWTFSAAYNLTKKSEYLQIAARAYQYLRDYFVDQEFGGVYWTVDYKCKPLDTKKQIYASAFAVYALSEYYQASAKEDVKQAAIDIYNDIVRYSYDQRFGGYVEALSREWNQLDDLRLSSKDVNEPKSMNTHLHVLEAFTNLYRIWPDYKLKEEIKELIHLFLDHIISRSTHHLHLFFDEVWTPKSHITSYGHDIEAAWLIPEAAVAIDEQLLLQQVNHFSLLLTEAAAKGLDGDGGLWYEYDEASRRLVKQKHWWPQAEAMIGFFNAWQITGTEKQLERSLRCWQFIQQFIHDKKGGEWKWGVNEDYSGMDKEDKVGIWKCPYHNSRACIEIIERISGLLNRN